MGERLYVVLAKRRGPHCIEQNLWYLQIRYEMGSTWQSIGWLCLGMQETDKCKRHRCERSIREGTGGARISISGKIRKQLGLGTNAAVDWDMFCREVCEVSLFQRREKIGGPGKLVQIDESKKESTTEGMWWRTSGFSGVSREIHANPSS